jgi:protein-disulfide isomerase
MSDTEPTLTSYDTKPVPPMLPQHGTPDSKPPFDRSKLLIPGAIILAGLIISASILYSRLEAGQTLLNGSTVTVTPKTKVSVNVAGAPMLGKTSAPVTVVEFADYQCPFCERFFKTNQSAIVADYVNSGKVKFVWMDYAFLGQESIWAAEAARCANDQGKFWQYHSYLFNHQGAENSGAYSKAKLKEFAVALGLNTAQFNTCLDSDTHLADVQKDTKYGSSLGVSGTPATFINGILITGAVPYSDIKSAIDAALAK